MEFLFRFFHLDSGLEGLGDLGHALGLVHFGAGMLRPLRACLGACCRWGSGRATVLLLVGWHAGGLGGGGVAPLTPNSDSPTTSVSELLQASALDMKMSKTRVFVGCTVGGLGFRWQVSPRCSSEPYVPKSPLRKVRPEPEGGVRTFWGSSIKPGRA